MSYLEDVITYHSGTECPDSFLIWSALSIQGALAGKKLWTMHGDYFMIDARNYACLVGTQGSGKSTAKDFAFNIVMEHFPSHMVSADIQSREDICKKMGAPEAVFTWTDKNGVLGLPTGVLEWRPFYALVDELSLFVSVGSSHSVMIGFLVGIYSNPWFSTGFKNDDPKGQRFKNPYFSMLSCTIPDWLMDNLKVELFRGGLGRRLNIVYDQKTKRMPNPTKPDKAGDMYARILTHLKWVTSDECSGPMVKTPDAQRWWDDWYLKPDRINYGDLILVGIQENEHIQLLKISMGLALSEHSMRLDTHHLERALVLLNHCKESVSKLTSGIGRNETAGVGVRLLDFIERIGGMVPEIEIRKQFRKDLKTTEFYDVQQDFMKTKQLYTIELPTSVPGLNQVVYMLPEKMWEYVHGLVEKGTLPGFMQVTHDELRERYMKNGQ